MGGWIAWMDRWMDAMDEWMDEWIVDDLHLLLAVSGIGGGYR